MTRDLKAAYRSDEDMSLDERAEAQRQIVAEYRWQVYGSPGGQPDISSAQIKAVDIAARTL